MAERDPRTDPKAGDVLRKGKRTRNILGTVPQDAQICKGHIAFRYPSDRKDEFHTECPEWFFGWAKDATVVRRAEDGQ